LFEPGQIGKRDRGGKKSKTKTGRTGSGLKDFSSKKPTGWGEKGSRKEELEVRVV